MNNSTKNIEVWFSVIIAIWLFFMPLIVLYHKAFLPSDTSLLTKCSEVDDLFSYGKLVWLIFGVVICFVFWGIGVTHLTKLYSFNLVDQAIFVMLGCVFVSYALSPYKSLAFWGYPQHYMGSVAFTCMLLICIFLRMRSNDMDWNCIWLGMITSSAVVSMIGIAQYLGYDLIKSPVVLRFIFGQNYPIMQFAVQSNLDYGRVYGTIGNENYFAIYLLVIIPICFHVLHENTSAVTRWLCTITISTSIFGILITQSVYNSMLLVLFLIYVGLEKLKKHFLFLNYSQFILIFGSLLAGAIYCGVMANVNLDALLSYRGFIWKNVVKIILDSPLFGYGADTLVMLVPKMNELIIVKPHQVLLQFAYNFGVVAVPLFIYICVKSIMHLPLYLRCGVVVLLCSGALHDLVISSGILLFVLIAYSKASQYENMV